MNQNQIKTVSHYLAYDNSCPGIFEFIDGQCIPRQSPDLIAENFRNEGYRIAGSQDIRIVMNHRLRIALTDNYCYPELTVVVEDPAVPLIVLEVVFDETQHMDRVIKSSLYRSMSFVKQLLLVSATNVNIQSLERSDEGDWRLREYTTLKDSVHLDSLGMSVPLSAIYCHAFMRPIAIPAPPPEVEVSPRDQLHHLSKVMTGGTAICLAVVTSAYLYAVFRGSDATSRWLAILFTLTAMVGLAIPMWRARKRPFISFFFTLCGLFFVMNFALAMITIREPESKYQSLLKGLRWACWMQMYFLFICTLQLFFLRGEKRSDF